MERFKDLEWFSEVESTSPVIVGGVGGIGSFLALWLSRLPLKLILFDNDTIDKTNMSGQHYRYEDIGLRKTRAVADQISSFSNQIVGTKGVYDTDSVATPVMFAAFDNMKARKVFFENWKQQSNRMVLIDGRMLAESFQIYIVTPENEELYEKEHLFSDDEAAAAQEACSARATTHCGAAISSFMVGAFTNYLSNKKLGINMREVPFKLSYHLDLFHQEMINNEEPKNDIVKEKVVYSE